MPSRPGCAQKPGYRRIMPEFTADCRLEAESALSNVAPDDRPRAPRSRNLENPPLFEQKLASPIKTKVPSQSTGKTER